MTLLEIQRILLLVGIAIVAYLLVQAWVSDAEKLREAETEQLQSTPLSSDEATGATSEDTPQELADSSVESLDQTAANEDLDSDVPDSSMLQSDRGQIMTTSSAESVSRTLIKVTTPLYYAWIDPVGGDVVGWKLIAYPISLKEPDSPMTLLDRRADRTYIAQSGLMGEDGLDQPGGRPVYSVTRNDWNLEEGALNVKLTYEEDGVEVTKSFDFYADRYDIDVNYDVRNTSSQNFSANFFAQLKRDGGPADGKTGGFIRPPAYVGAAITTESKHYKRLKFKDIDKNAYREAVNGGWVAILQHYFLSTWIPNQNESNLYFGSKDRQGNYRFGFTGPTQVITPGTSGSFGAKLYVGPKHQDALDALAPHLALTVDYGFFWWLSVPMFKVLDWIHSLVKNWGLAIILMTILIKTVLFPLSQMSYRSMAKMRKLSPQIKRIQERFGGDRQRMGQEMMSLYQKEKTNPLAGCFPMLLQMPVFFALYWVLIESVELRHAPFLFWIRDLSAMDPLFVLPILNAGVMFLMQRLNPPMPDPMQQRVMMMMPIMFGAICLFMPAGLVLYWLVNSLYSMAHHYWALKRAGAPT
ncbi:MAG: membrane protein insertase YidC [Gammaproteobacteria bacterium]|nr:membrane protein insertase YidC [Gammaproteobacteria bacterium]